MRKIVHFLSRIVDYFTPEVDDDVIAVKKRDGILRHMEIPDEAFGIYRWYNLYYETSTSSALPSNCMEVVSGLAALKFWNNPARKYITTYEWIKILHSEDPGEVFVSLVMDIEHRYLL